MLCISGFADDVMFSHDGANSDTGHSQIIHRDSPGGAGAKSDLTDCLVLFLEMFSCKYGQHDNILECGPMPNVMAALPNIGAAVCTTPQFC